MEYLLSVLRDEVNHIQANREELGNFFEIHVEDLEALLDEIDKLKNGGR